MNEMLEDKKDMKYIKWTQILRDMKKIRKILIQ
jgi:hypothetical protein